MQNRNSFFVIHFENKTMVRRCCVPKCTGNSNEENKERVFRFPNKDEEKEAWRKAILRTNLPTSNTTVVCERHMPPGYETTTAHGKVRPKNPHPYLTDSQLVSGLQLLQSQCCCKNSPARRVTKVH